MLFEKNIKVWKKPGFTIAKTSVSKNKLDVDFSMDEKLSDIGCVSINNLIGEHIKAFFNGAPTITKTEYQPTVSNHKVSTPTSDIIIPKHYPDLNENKITILIKSFL